MPYTHHIYQLYTRIKNTQRLCKYHTRNMYTYINHVVHKPNTYTLGNQTMCICITHKYYV